MNNPEDIKKNVLERIRSGQVAMHSRAYFAVRVAGAIALIALALALIALIASFGFWSVHESGEWLLLGFGGRGVSTFLGFIPWTGLILVAVFVALIGLQLRRFRLGYRSPLLFAFAAILAASFALGFIVSLTPLHPLLQERADRGELPFVGELYEALRAPQEDRGVFRGTVTAIGTDGFSLACNDRDTDADERTYTVTPPSGFDAASLHVGERLYVAGDAASGTVRAYGIHPL
ncbi:MAG: hypothetical protein KGI41_00300 [Patescibacteria group bacterium]|nr:hypothetical protein [Patescibacteria group bacterium]MDE1965673.1 hypothetical protein [Patescibacteria group bacterium]